MSGQRHTGAGGFLRPSACYAQKLHASRNHMTFPDPAPLKAVRLGRPRAEEAGLVDERILIAATTLFMEQGFGRTTMDQVSALSKAGKSTLYGRYPAKEELFSAVVQRSIGLMFTEMHTGPGTDSPARRLRHVGCELARNLLLPRCVKLMRIIAAEADNFPALAEAAYQASSAGCILRIEAALHALHGTTHTVKDIPCLATHFMEMTLQPIAFQAIMGGDHGHLLDKSIADIDYTIALMVESGQISA
jgi:AcrR family transcriptional regulator